MKNLLFTLLISLLSANIFCQFDSISLGFDEVRELHELNESDLGEGYPWISNDGLRIYYTQQNFVNVISQREHIDSLFSEPRVLTVNSDSTNNFSPWLTEDELDIYFVSADSEDSGHTNLYHATREDINDEFGTPVEVILNGSIEDFYSSPSFTEDLEQLFIYGATGLDNDTIFYYEKSDINAYDLVDRISIPLGLLPAPGKLSKNGLRYYIPISNSAGINKKIYVAERESLNSSFNSFYYIDNESINGPDNDYIQPAVSRDRRFMVFVRSNGITWNGNDMFIAYNSDPVSVKEYEYVDDFEIKVSPNPASNYIRFEILDDDQLYKTINLIIYSSDGRLLDEIAFQDHNNTLRLPTIGYNSGMYFFKLISEIGDSKSGNFMINK